MPLLTPQLLSELQSVEINDVEYFILWNELQIHFSFFIPTLATIKQVKLILDPIAKILSYKLEYRTRCEYGRYGVRVWRTY
jgi:hypothetical protein